MQANAIWNSFFKKIASLGTFWKIWIMALLKHVAGLKWHRIDCVVALDVLIAIP